MVKFRLYFDKEKEAEWLNEMAAKGCAITDYVMGFYAFRECLPGEYVYQIDIVDGFFGVNDDYKEFMEEAGVELVCQWGCWVILSKKAEGNALAPLFVCQHFKMERLDVQDQIRLFCGEQSFYCLLFLEGAGSIIHAGQKFDFTAGDCYFIPAGLGEYRVEGVCMALAAHI